jgi:hypothetical protein
MHTPTVLLAGLARFPRVSTHVATSAAGPNTYLQTSLELQVTEALLRAGYTDPRRLGKPVERRDAKLTARREDFAGRPRVAVLSGASNSTMEIHALALSPYSTRLSCIDLFFLYFQEFCVRQ